MECISVFTSCVSISRLPITLFPHFPIYIFFKPIILRAYFSCRGKCGSCSAALPVQLVPGPMTVKCPVPAAHAGVQTNFCRWLVKAILKFLPVIPCLCPERQPNSSMISGGKNYWLRSPECYSLR